MSQQSKHSFRPTVVVLENGDRNQGWEDFRDNHLIPEFKEPAAPSEWEFVKVVTSSEMAWSYTKQTIDVTGKDSKHVSYLVWSAYVLQKAGSTWKVVLLDWSVRRSWFGWLAASQRESPSREVEWDH